MSKKFDIAHLVALSTDESDKTISLSPLEYNVVLAALADRVPYRATWTDDGQPVSDVTWDEIDATIASINTKIIIA